MRITDLDGIPVVELASRIDVSTAPALENLLNGLLDDGRTGIICDFAATEYISSLGLRVFLSALKRTAKAGGSLVLCSLKPGILEIFDMTGFTGLFAIFPSAEAARGFFRALPPDSAGPKSEQELLIDRQPDEVTRAYAARPAPVRMDEKA
ncbi:STAS domain-containing protein [Anaeroselena agilis]|uniref:Anti-sigma factor antagonist n=1 Tax=Anaeroselena agilis TaxID=3063788 RepID=A0ABU3NZ33_9FIRM|nr:STAS domain-containing protein [Selenomonadales bacterium 4137-cl]